MAFSTEELIQIGLFVGIIIVFGLVVYNYLKNKGKFEKRKEEKKSLSFTKNRKMRGLEKLIPEKKLSRKPTMTEIKFENDLWEPDEIELKKEDLIKKTEKKEELLLKEEKIKKTEVSLAEIKSKGKFSFKRPFGRKTEEKPIQITPEEKKQEKTELKPLTEIKPKGKFAFNKIISGKKEEKTIQPKEEKYAQVGKKLEEKIREMEEKKKSEKVVDLFVLPEDKGTGKTAARKILEGIKPEPKLFRSQEEKEKHEKKFVQKILDSQEDELESISKAIETKPDEKWKKEKEETIKALRKEFEEIDKKEDLWTEKKGKTEEGQKKEIMETKEEKQEEKENKEKETKKEEPPLAEIELNGKFAFKKEHIEQKKESKKNKGFNEEMKKLLEEKRKKIKKQKGKTFEPKKIRPEKPETKIKKEEIFIQPKPETKKPVLNEKEEKIIPKTLNAQEPAKAGKYTFEPTQEEIEIKKMQEKPKKKGLFARFGIGTEKVKLTKEEEEKAQKILMVLKEKKAEYSKEDMIEAMKNLGYSEKITQEVLRRLYG